MIQFNIFKYSFIKPLVTSEITDYNGLATLRLNIMDKHIFMTIYVHPTTLASAQPTRHLGEKSAGLSILLLGNISRT